MILAIPLRTMDVPDRWPWDKHSYICDHYKRIFDPMGIPLFPVYSDNCAEGVSRICDGLIVDGTVKNVFPEYYGQERLPEMAHTYTVDEYASDIKLVEAFHKAGKPIVGICGGIQILNVYFGGTLNQHVHGHNKIHAGHRLHVEKDSFLHRVYGAETVDVNSYHDQCVDRVAPGFTVTARAEDGTIEAIENGNIIGVQWHPEVSLDVNFFRRWIDEFF